MAPRPGSVAARRLYANDDPAAWSAALSRYGDCIKNIKGKATQQLSKDDKWWREELPATVQKRKPRHLTKSELERVMRWKLARGRWRPLQGMVAENKEDLVISCTTKAFAAGKNVKRAVTELTPLRAIGPATATAILAVVQHDIPFMADESMEGSVGERNYTLNHCLDFTSALRKRAKILGSAWTAETVGRAMWAAAKAHEFGLTPPPKSDSKKKRGQSEVAPADPCTTAGTNRRGGKRRCTASRQRATE